MQSAMLTSVGALGCLNLGAQVGLVFEGGVRGKKESKGVDFALTIAVLLPLRISLVGLGGGCTGGVSC